MSVDVVKANVAKCFPRKMVIDIIHIIQQVGRGMNIHPISSEKAGHFPETASLGISCFQDFCLYPVVDAGYSIAELNTKKPWNTRMERRSSRLLGGILEGSWWRLCVARYGVVKALCVAML